MILPLSSLHQELKCCLIDCKVLSTYAFCLPKTMKMLALVNSKPADTANKDPFTL